MSRIYFLLVLIGSAFNLYCQQDTLTISGTYYGRHLYFQNPETDEEGVYATISIQINGQFYPQDSLDPGACEIIPSLMGAAKGDPLNIEIIYHSGYRPYLLGPHAPLPKPIRVEHLAIDELGHICWDISGLDFADSLVCFQVQRYYWNKWNNEGTVCMVDGDGQYCHDVMEMDGENLVRICAVEGMPYYISETVRFYSNRPKVTYTFDKRSKKLEFPEYLPFELYNEKGEMLMNEVQKVVDLSALPKGKYYLNYWNTSTILRLK